MKILITGITGNAGREIYRSLYRRKGDAPDRELVAGVRNPSGVVAEPGVEYRTLDFMDESSYDKALDGIDRLFLVRPPAISQVEKSIFPFLEKVKEKGVECVSFLSLVGVENNRITPHYKIEQEIIRLGIDAIFLRPSFFMENLLEAHREEIRDEDRIMIPAGSGKTNFIAVQDIGEAGAITLLEKNCSFKGSSSSEGQRYAAFELTGERSYDYYEIAEILSGVLGRKIRYYARRPLETRNRSPLAPGMRAARGFFWQIPVFLPATALARAPPLPDALPP